MKKPGLTEGWLWLWNSPKFHYFREGRSLCKRWGVWSNADLQTDDDLIGEEPNRDDCKTCWKKRKSELETLKKQEG